ncbi:50S ribosomal protein L6 [candidate division WWE3 bacterium RIFCSPLOWO2_01_FULL_42_11]|uniref:Large ribosomal subunit protein uL6 n=1 Tax=candidate division WWE3 bacterium RIFCSPLOWO2_01_FULL_42_11 TaxID=1802627 RepID=A0A1F4VRJ7_UNCKA|nr:MAG: 50S ribosomal protein L6 [candidate division WWE3 bacterium RIFCSPLOWO2_01_FULL_42_11]
MSRLGKQPIAIPEGVVIEVTPSNVVSITGPKGNFSHQLSKEVGIEIRLADLSLTKVGNTPSTSAQWGLTRALIRNMVQGVTTGFIKDLEIVGVGYRVLSLGPTKLQFSLGLSHPVIYEAPEGINFEVTDNNKIRVLGISRFKVGLVSAQIRDLKPPEPYKGKGIRYADEKVKRKAGKSGKATAK